MSISLTPQKLYSGKIVLEKQHFIGYYNNKMMNNTKGRCNNMKLSKKRILAVLLCLAVMLPSLGMGAWAADTTTVYCNAPADWGSCFIYWWGTEDSPQWPGVTMERDEQGIWFYSVPTDVSGLIFSNGDGQKTADLQVPPDENVMYLVEKKGWTRYGETEVPALYIVAGSGSLCGSDWNPSDRSNRMSDEDGDGIYTRTYENVAAGTYELKVTTGSWSQSWGDPEKGSNYILTVTQNGTDVTVGFDTATEKILIFLNGELPEPPPASYTLSGSISGKYQAVLTGESGSKEASGSGTYTFKQVLPGEYQLTFSVEGYVTRTYTVTVTDGDVTLDAVLNLQGDVSGDGKINLGDAARIYAHVRGSKLLADYTLCCADYSADGTVNVGDAAKLYAFIRSEKPPVTPEPPVTPDPPVSGVYVVGEDALPYSDEEIYQQLFDPNSKLEIDLDMSDAELQKLQ